MVAIVLLYFFSRKSLTDTRGVSKDYSSRELATVSYRSIILLSGLVAPAVLIK
jgi:hypothetical protein